MLSESAKRRERRRKAREAHEAAEHSATIRGRVLGYADGQTEFVLVRKGEEWPVFPSKECQRKDLFEYWPRTLAVRGLTVLALSWGWRLQDG